MRPPAGRLVRQTTRRLVDRSLAHLGYSLIEHDPSFTHALVDKSTPLPPVASDLRLDNRRLRELQATYETLDWPVCQHSVWNQARRTRWDAPPATGWRFKLNLQYFRGDSSYIWHYRETRRSTELKYFVYLEEVRRRDSRGLLSSLGEDGAFGCWFYDFVGRPRCSRDLLDSVNELLFLDRHLGVLDGQGLRVLDIGAGYGRLAHRFAQAVPGLADYCCVDAIATSTFLCEFYTRYRGITPPVRVVPLPDVPELQRCVFDLACNVHSWSECTGDAIRWWVDHLAQWQVPRLFVVPNEPDEFLSLESNGTRRDYLTILERGGYRLTVSEAAVPDAAVRELVPLDDRHYLFELRS